MNRQVIRDYHKKDSKQKKKRFRERKSLGKKSEIDKQKSSIWLHFAREHIELSVQKNNNFRRQVDVINDDQWLSLSLSREFIVSLRVWRNEPPHRCPDHCLGPSAGVRDLVWSRGRI